LRRDGSGISECPDKIKRRTFSHIFYQLLAVYYIGCYDAIHEYIINASKINKSKLIF
jgi:hypothetical protein